MGAPAIQYRQEVHSQYDAANGMELDGNDEIIGDVDDNYLPNQGKTSTFAALPRMDMEEIDERSAPPRFYET